MWSVIVIMILSYLCGSIPTSIIVARITRGIDIRNFGSGNAGGTNTFRVLGWKAGLIVSIFDILKGVLATALIARLRIDPLPFADPTFAMILAGMSAIIGHAFTIFAGFRGGKGVATGAGMIIALFPIALLFCMVVFAAVLFSTGIVSISSISAALTLPLSLLVMRYGLGISVNPVLLYFSLLIPLFIVYTHRSNIQRLLKGEENRFEKLRIFRRRPRQQAGN